MASLPKLTISTCIDLKECTPSIDKGLVAFTKLPLNPLKWDADGLTINISCSPSLASYQLNLIDEEVDKTGKAEGTDKERQVIDIEPCTLEDIQLLFDFLEGVRDYTEIVFWDEFDNELSFAACLSAFVYYGKDIVDSLFSLVKNYPEIAPDSPWLIGLVDYALSLQGQLMQVYDEYLATKIVVNKRGIAAQGIWQRELTTL